MYENDLNQVILAKHYPGIKPRIFIEISNQINLIYEGRIREGSTHTPTAEGQEKARNMWKKAYMKLKPYEETINQDYSILETFGHQIHDITAKRAVKAMHDICQKYHEIVEPWEELMSQDDIWDIADASVTEEVQQSNLVDYDSQKAMDYYANLKQEFDLNSRQALEGRLTRWWKKIPAEKKDESVRIKKIELEEDLQNSGFLNDYPFSYSIDFMEGIVATAADGAEAQQMCDNEVFAYALNDLYDGINILNEEKIERYIWTNQNNLTDDKIEHFLIYEYSQNYLQELSDIFHKRPEEFYEKYREQFEEELEEEIKGDLLGWFNSLSEEEKEDAIKQKADLLRIDFFNSSFLSHYQTKITDSGIHEIAIRMKPDETIDDIEGWVRFIFSMKDLCGDARKIGTKIIPYLWKNRSVLTESQIMAFFTFDFSLPYIYGLEDNPLKAINLDFWESVSSKLAKLEFSGDKSIKLKFAPLSTFFHSSDSDIKPDESMAIFPPNILQDTNIFNKFYNIIKDNISPRTSMNSGKRETKWKWWHVRETLIQLDFIEKNASPGALASALGKISGRTQQSINQAFKRHNGKAITNSDQNIINNIKAEFQPVIDMLKKR